MTITAERYDTATGRTGALAPDEMERPGRPGTIVWIDADDPDESELQRLSRALSVTLPERRPLVFEALRSERDLLVFTVRAVRFDEARAAVEQAPVTVIARPDRFATVKYRGAGTVQALRSQWRRGNLGEAALTYCLFLVFDTVLDTYLMAVNGIQAAMDRVRDTPDPGRMAVVFGLRTQLYRLLEYLRPYGTDLHTLLRSAEGKNEFAMAPGKEYTRHVNDHLRDAKGEVHVCLEMLNGIVQEREEDQANTMNVQMARLTVLGTLLATFEVLVGMFSMNLVQRFPGIPPLLGVFIMFCLLAGVAVVELYYFKKKGWLK